MARIRVLVVDDSSVARHMVTGVLEEDPDLEIVGTASTGPLALAKVTQLNPDVVTLDVEMPGMSGIEVLAKLRATHRSLPIIMFSSITVRGARATLDALFQGANDYVTKPDATDDPVQAIRSVLIPKIKAHAARARVAAGGHDAAALTPRPSVLPGRPPTSVPKILAIGVSTGGPKALLEVFRKLPAAFRLPVVVVQHMPPLFTKIFAERVTAETPLKLVEAAGGERIHPGQGWLAPGGVHMTVARDGDSVFVRTNHAPPENDCRPAVDVLFRSVGNVYGTGAWGLVMTGLGVDGLRGSRVIHEGGGRMWAQDEATSVAWSMPGAVVGAGLAHRVLPLGEIGPAIVREVDTWAPPGRATAP